MVESLAQSYTACTYESESKSRSLSSVACVFVLSYWLIIWFPRLHSSIHDSRLSPPEKGEQCSKAFSSLALLQITSFCFVMVPRPASGRRSRSRLQGPHKLAAASVSKAYFCDSAHISRTGPEKSRAAFILLSLLPSRILSHCVKKYLEKGVLTRTEHLKKLRTVRLGVIGCLLKGFAPSPGATSQNSGVLSP